MSDDVDLAMVTVTVAPGRQLDVLTLIAAWRAQVARFEADLLAPSGGRPARGARDYVAALYFRDWIAQASAVLPTGPRHRLDRAVADLDARFLALTEPDIDGLVDRATDDPDSTRDWWWHRIPRTGPVRDDFRRHYRAVV
ncbi:hypothetical protein [Catenuloplanes atrovinosus]|uniref:Uncharacterized protein n=1 Tax=Catenuloplanes atrovinosus TaxID=137266 RepID=A0AAE3YTR5_9ACTN|nr:hypothetical protein [Catenuloplanes atrovinosus]MDR7279067.1 hypothetical protein [Catenuloplanes atrovinosus]